MNGHLAKSSFDSWFEDAGPAAVVLIEQLEPVAGVGSVVFPPTYAPEQASGKKQSEYVINTLRDGRTVCQIDSVGSQANRIEPIFKREPYSYLVPQVTVTVGSGQEVNLLDAGHRAADAIVRFSSLGAEIRAAFAAWFKGDAAPLAAIAPTSLLFGSWDSRDTQAKAPRLISSIIRAYDVDLLTRSAQYVPALDYSTEVLGEDLSPTDEQKAELGLSHVPAPKALGGVLVNGEIRKEATLNLVSLRGVAVLSDGREDGPRTLLLRRYLLGLALVAITKPMAHNLRQGCLLIGVEAVPPDFKLIFFSGKREAFIFTHEEALAYATQAATDYGVNREYKATFDPKLLKNAVDKKASEKEAKKTAKKAAKEG